MKHPHYPLIQGNRQNYPFFQPSQGRVCEVMHAPVMTNKKLECQWLFEPRFIYLDDFMFAFLLALNVYSRDSGTAAIVNRVSWVFALGTV